MAPIIGCCERPSSTSDHTASSPHLTDDTLQSALAALDHLIPRCRYRCHPHGKWRVLSIAVGVKSADATGRDTGL